MPSMDKPAFVPFFESTLNALANLSPEDVRSYVAAIRAYVYEGVEPNCTGEGANCTPVAMAIFEMGRYQLDETLKRSATNRSNARSRRRGQRKSEAGANDERSGSETGANGERTGSDLEANDKRNANEPVATEERTGSDTEATDQRNGIYSNNQVSNISSSSSSSKGAGADFSIPEKGEWIAYFNGKCAERGIPPDSDQAAQAWAYYDDHGWCHRDGTGFKNWHRQCTTCVKRYQNDLENRRKGGVNRASGRGKQGPFSGATADFDRAAIDGESLF